MIKGGKIMGKNKYFNDVTQIEKATKKLDDQQAKVQAECYHHGKDSMAPSLIKVKASGDNKYVFKCTNCKKVINLRSMDDKTREDALKIIDAMVDLIKIQLDPNKEEDKKLIENLALFQYKLNRRLELAYSAIVLGKSKKRKKRNDDNRTSSDFWGKSVVR